MLVKRLFFTYFLTQWPRCYVVTCGWFKASCVFLQKCLFHIQSFDFKGIEKEIYVSNTKPYIFTIS